MAKATANETALVTIIHAQNEIGTLQPVAEIVRQVQSVGALIHTDAAQSIGKVVVDVNKLGVDLLSIAGHKLYAPKGTGALYVRRGVKLPPLLVGASQERGLRPGTENVAYIVALGEACRLASMTLEKASQQMAFAANHFFRTLQQNIPEIALVGHPTERLPNTLNVLFPGVRSSTSGILSRCFRFERVRLPCRQRRASAILLALGIPREKALGTVRLSLGRSTTIEDVSTAAARLVGTWHSLQRSAPVRVLERRIDERHAANRLSHLSHGGGCGCKLAPSVLQQLLSNHPTATPYKQLLVGLETGDDAAVWQLDNGTCIIATTDFFMPMVDDPYDFGRIAASNAISDVYAMGGSPIMALAILGMPVDKIPPEMVRRILEGGASVCSAAGIPVAGGHSIDSPEPIYGLAVIGISSKANIRRNSDAKAGDRLILTKALGVGVYSAAFKKNALSRAAYDEFIASTTLLNRVGTRLGEDPDVHAMTDVTGFGLLGHALEIARGSNMTVRIDPSRLPYLKDAATLAQNGFVTGASGRNWKSYDTSVTLPAGTPDWQRQLFCDPQTSGGLLVSCAPAHADELLKTIVAAGYPDAKNIGYVTDGKPGVHVECA